MSTPFQLNLPRCTGHDSAFGLSRRQALATFGHGLGAMALGTMLNPGLATATDSLPFAPHFAPTAKRVIFLFQSGGPSQIESFDYKPTLNQRHGEELPDSVRKGQRLTGMSGHQASLPLVGSPFKFAQHGQSGAWVSDQMPHTAEIVDDLCFIKSMYTEAINHGPGVTFMQTGSAQHGSVVVVRTGIGKQGHSQLRGTGNQRAGRPTSGFKTLGKRIPARQIRRRATAK